MKLEEWLEIDAYEPMPTGAGTVAVDRYIPANDKLAIRLFDTEYEVGKLNLRVPDEEAESEQGVVKFVNFTLTLVMHPTRGVLNTGVIEGGEEIDWRAYLEELHGRLDRTCETLRETIREHRSTRELHSYWSNCSLPIAPALVRRGAPAEIDPEKFGADPSIVIDTDWENLPERLGAVMDEYTRNAAGETYVGRQLSTALKNLQYEYLDHVDWIAAWQFVTDQLFESEEVRAA